MFQVPGSYQRKFSWKTSESRTLFKTSEELHREISSTKEKVTDRKNNRTEK